MRYDRIHVNAATGKLAHEIGACARGRRAWSSFTFFYYHFFFRIKRTSELKLFSFVKLPLFLGLHINNLVPKPGSQGPGHHTRRLGSAVDPHGKAED